MTTTMLLFSYNCPGHRELSDAVPDISRMYNEFQFSEELELAISEFAPQAVKDVKDRKTLSDLTYEKVFWAGKIENPMVCMLVSGRLGL